MVTLLSLAAGSACAQTPDVAAYAEQVTAANRRVERIAPISAIAPGVSIAQSYRIEKQVVNARLRSGDKIVGFKGGLVRPGQKIAGVAVEPVFGVLLQSGVLPMGGDVPLSRYRSLVVECEVAFTFGTRIAKPVANVEALKRLVSYVRPAIELPDMALNGPVGSAQDLIAINVAASHHILGASLSPATAIDAVTPVLSRDGQPVARGDVREAVGDPWAVLLRLVNMLVGQGYALEKGQSLLSGAILAQADLKPGSYHADFGRLGAIDFKIVP